MNISTYKHNVITVIKLVILQNFTRKKNYLKPTLNNLLYRYKI